MFYKCIHADNTDQVHSFQQLYGIPAYESTTICLSVSLLRDI